MKLLEKAYVDIPTNVRELKDPDSVEFVRLWDERGLKGITYTIETEDGTVAGYSLLEIRGEDDYYNCRGFYSSPDFRGQRIGTRILQKCIDFTDSIGADLWGNIIDGSPSKNILVREGFVPVERRKDVPNCTKLIRLYQK